MKLLTGRMKRAKDKQMITKLWVKNYRSLANLELRLEPITVLVGPNGSGKSNIVDVLRFIHDALRGGLDSAIVNRQGMSAVRRWSAKGRPYDVELGVTISAPTFSGSYNFVLGSERRGEYRVKREICHLKSAQNGAETVFETDAGEWLQQPSALTPAIHDNALTLPLLANLPLYKELYEYLTAVSFYNIFPNTISEPQKPGNPYPLDEHGANLASTLRDLKRANSDLLEPLQRALSAVLPDVLDFQVNQVGGYLVTRLRHQISQESEERATFELAQESDGTLRILGILTALYQDPPRTLIVLEEPELTIHPGALSLLWEEIESASKRSQIILTTHSPDLLDMCQAEQLRVVEKIAGITYADIVADAQKEAIQERLFAPGELLRAQGLHRATQIPLPS